MYELATVHACGLMSCSVDTDGIFKLAADYVARIINGLGNNSLTVAKVLVD